MYALFQIKRKTKMLLTLKNLQQQTFTIEIDASETVRNIYSIQGRRDKSGINLIIQKK
jgi:hypothetical protein